MRVVHARLEDNGRQTLGRYEVFNGINPVPNGRFVILEPAWKNNEVQKSCIPAGRYRVVPFDSPKFGRCFAILNVPNRTEIRIHKGVYRAHTLGCQVIGNDFGDINKDGDMDVIGSKFALPRLLELCPEGFVLDIVPV